MVRAKISLPPPAAAWTTNSMGRSGFQLDSGSFGIAVPACANTGAKGEPVSANAITHNIVRVRVMTFLLE